ncbi:MAG TPA: TetR/AcrR family transcriptional regulator [Woeseiaceae bacterium]|nr:TetR/AcrR family transcriptional regulator [Woeseiaceae bacterium]
MLLQRKLKGFRRTDAGIHMTGSGIATQVEESRFQLQKDRMLKAAAHCFNQKGFSGTSLKDVANRLSLTDAALYYYVRNKEELVYLCYVRATEVGHDAMQSAIAAGGTGFEVLHNYLRNHVATMVGEQGPVAIMSEIPSLEVQHRDEIMELSRKHGAAFEALIAQGIDDGSIKACDIRMTGNAIMGAINWIPKWFHGDARLAAKIVSEFPGILSAGLKNG